MVIHLLIITLMKIIGKSIKGFFPDLQTKNKTGAFRNESNMSPPACHWMESIFFVEESEIVN